MPEKRDSEELPADVTDEAERLTRLARDTRDDAEASAYRESRDELLAKYGYVARVREDETRAVLVLHPAEWTENGTIQTDRIDDIDRGVERPLSGPGEADEWETIETHNREVATTVAEEYGDVHGANAHAFADFMSNHLAKPLESATKDEIRDFRKEYFPRNAWPTDEQRERIEQSLEYVFEIAETERDPV